MAILLRVFDEDGIALPAIALPAVADAAFVPPLPILWLVLLSDEALAAAEVDNVEFNRGGPVVRVARGLLPAVENGAIEEFRSL